MPPVLLLFAKVPRPGDVKTRLTPPLTPSEAARLYTAFLRDTVRAVVRMKVDVRLYLAPPLPEDDELGLPTELSVHEQRGESLGARMAQACRETFDAGADRAVLLGTDHPTLPASFVTRAIDGLEEPRSICIGPTEDGGFYLLGMNEFYPVLFREMSYSHADVFSETCSRIRRTDAQLTVLPTWYDVDTPADLDRLSTDLAEKESVAPNTSRVINRLDLPASS